MVAGLIIKNRNPDKSENPKENQQDKSKAQDLIDAVHSKDAKAVESAFKAMFKACEKEPHEEVEHKEPHSYENQKEE